MKYVVIVPDGASDYPLEILGQRTPLEAADLPNIDALAKEGILGRVKTVPKGFKPSSDIANLSLLGYNPDKYYTGRGPLEAVNLGVTLGDDDIAFRCNLITESEGKLMDYSAGHIRDKESRIIMEYLAKRLGTDKVKFIAGKSYRNLTLFKEAGVFKLDELSYMPPHDIMGQEIEKNLPQGAHSEMIVDLMRKSKEILSGHEVNKVRVDLGENPANMIWLWGCGKRPTMEPFKEKYGVSGAVISAVDLINGIGRIIGLNVLEVEGVTGYYDTNYKGKALAAVEALKKVDFVFVHIEATDEAGHNGDLRMKIACLERIDQFVVGPIMRGLKGVDCRILIVPDHPTPVEKRTHTDEPVPFLIWGSGIEGENFSSFSEIEAQGSSLFFETGVDLLEYFLKG